MKTQNNRHSTDLSNLPNFNTKKTKLHDCIQAALTENGQEMVSIQEMKTVILLAEFVKALEKWS